MSPLTAAEAKTVGELKAREEMRLLPERERKRSEWSLPRLKALVANGVKEPEARIIVNRMIDDGELHGTFIQQFDDLGDAAVSEVFSDPDKYVGKGLSDPHEGPAYGRGKAILFRRKDGSLFVNSFAHGGRKYALLNVPVRPFSVNSVLGIVRAVTTAAPEKSVALTTWGARLMAESVRAGKISADLAHRVLFEAAMRTGLPALEAGSIIETAFRSNSK
jgi:hypothetical protein